MRPTIYTMTVVAADGIRQNLGASAESKEGLSIIMRDMLSKKQLSETDSIVALSYYGGAVIDVYVWANKYDCFVSII